MLSLKPKVKLDKEHYYAFLFLVDHFSFCDSFWCPLDWRDSTEPPPSLSLCLCAHEYIYHGSLN